MAISALMPVYPRCEFAPVRGDGVWLYDAEGRGWLDFASGIAVNLLGHGHPHLVDAIQRQAATLMHVSNLYGSPQGEEVARRLVEHSFADTVFFTNSGAEAVECAIKTARSYQHANGRPERFRLITFSDAFHGRTLATIAATDQEKLHAGFEPVVADWFRTVPFNDLQAAKAALDDSVAGFLLEPIQGEGGIHPASHEFMQGLRQLADEQDLMLVLDEVQTGVGRTGTLFAYEHYGITPDIMAVAKGIGGGFPVGACLATEKAAAGMIAGRHGSTYGGNPLAMAAVGAVLDIVLEADFLPQVRTTADRLRAAINQLMPNHDMFVELRGEGLLLGLKLNVNSADFMVHARDKHGLLTVAAGDNVLRILPPLNIGDADINEFINRLSAAASSFGAGNSGENAG